LSYHHSTVINNFTFFLMYFPPNASNCTTLVRSSILMQSIFVQYGTQHSINGLSNYVCFWNNYEITHFYL
jgi:hypothetical protein